ncbi:hypothetical protein EBR43_03580 [bacterium]|jgi:hypothetical protein|nr:hypothetical protein [bacterium]NBW56861.1 hypothetical protein [bacterium]NBX71394.1 hypothetical protein [bacterium]
MFHISLLSYQYSWPDVIGNIGVAFLIGTYAALTAGKIDADGWVYPLFNLIAAFLLTISLCFNPNLSSLVIEFFWSVISIIGLYRYIKKVKK